MRSVEWLRGSHGSGRWWVAVAVIAAVGSWLYTGRNLSAELRSGDAIQYAAVARRLAAGEGFSTGIIFPAELAFGVTADHPSVVRPPLWPLVLAVAFRAAGPEDEAAFAAVFVCFVATLVAAGALAAQLAGPRIAVLTALAVAATPQLAYYSVDAVTEIPFALLVTLVFLLCAREASPLAIGVACGCAYLTRYNGLALLAMVAPLLWLRERRPRQLLAFSAGFGLVAAPWWVRNWIVAGHPFFSLYNLGPWFHPEMKLGFSLNYMVEPDLTSPAAIHPLQKAWILLPQLLSQFPLASANLAACAGIALACVRGQRLHLGFVGVAAATTLMAALAVPRGRYFAPFIPVLVALGAAAWSAYGGRLRLLGLGLVLAAPLLPSYPADLGDVRLLGIAIETDRLRARADATEGRSQRLEALARCLAGRPVVLAQDADRIHWATHAITIKMPGRPGDFRRILEEHPVRFLQIRDWRRVPVPRQEIERSFRILPGCGRELFQRRPETSSISRP